MESLLLPVGGRRLALALPAVRQTLVLGAVSPLPGAPPSVLGAINVHGEILVLLDTGLLLGDPPLEAPTHAAVATGRHGTAALAATAQPVATVLDAGTELDPVDALLDPARVAAAGC